MSPTLDECFNDKPDSRRVFDVIASRIAALGPSEIEVRSQISFAVNRKFAWFWLYNVTRKNPNGVPHLSLAIDRRVEHHGIRDITQISKSRWNHQVAVRTREDAASGWLGDLLADAYAYGAS